VSLDRQGFTGCGKIQKYCHPEEAKPTKVSPYFYGVENY
jgi:hypothetical protein